MNMDTNVNILTYLNKFYKQIGLEFNLSLFIWIIIHHYCKTLILEIMDNFFRELF